MEIKYQLFVEENLLIQKFIGGFSIEDYMRYSQFIRKIPNADSVRKVLIDFRDLIFDDLPEDPIDTVSKVAEFRKNMSRNEAPKPNIKLIFWVDKPIPTAIASIFIGIFSELDYNYFATVESIIEILDLPENLFNLEKIAANLENTF